MIFNLEENLALLDLLIKSSESGAQLSNQDIHDEVDAIMYAVSKIQLQK